MDKIDTINKDHRETMTGLTNNLKTLTETMAGALALLQQSMLYQLQSQIPVPFSLYSRPANCQYAQSSSSHPSTVLPFPNYPSPTLPRNYRPVCPEQPTDAMYNSQDEELFLNNCFSSSAKCMQCDLYHFAWAYQRRRCDCIGYSHSNDVTGTVYSFDV